MIPLKLLREQEAKIILLGSHPAIIQSMLDFDFLSGKKSPSIVGIIALGKSFERYFFGNGEIFIPVVSSLEKLPKSIFDKVNLFINVLSARRVLSSTKEALEFFPKISGGVIFAENVPEKHAIEIYKIDSQKKKFVIGPASVGLLIPGSFKLGAIGGTDSRQLVSASVTAPGDVAVFSASGGMTNEIINIVSQEQRRLSFVLSFGGDRFPILTPKEAFLAAEKDEKTKTIIYFGELGGVDEYEIADLLQENKITKEVICYIAGVVADMFPVSPQFGHAKAMAETSKEGAVEKREALRKAGAKVASTFSQFVDLIARCGGQKVKGEESLDNSILKDRKAGLITTTISKDVNGGPEILGENLLAFVTNHSYAYSVISLLLGRKISSKKLEEFVDFALKLLVDHGPYVSGALNTIVAARAGKDLVSSLVSGLLTIGPRFGGAINEAAGNFLLGVKEEKSAFDFVEEFASRKKYIAGIGHKKYRVDLPDPRVEAILEFSKTLSKNRFTNFAKEIEKVTSGKKGNLILNVDGALACVLLDILSEEEKMTDEQLRKLVDIEFFNALFVLSRSVGFVAHFLDQKRLNEGLFRMPEELITNIDGEGLL